MKSYYKTKKYFYSTSSLENISNSDCKNPEKTWIIFEMKNLEDYHDLYLQTDTYVN